MDTTNWWPGQKVLVAPVNQRLLPLDEDWCRKLTELPWPAKNVPEVIGRGG